MFLSLAGVVRFDTLFGSLFPYFHICHGDMIKGRKPGRKVFANCYCIIINKPPLSLYLHLRVSEIPKLTVLEVPRIERPTTAVLSKNRDCFKDEL